MEKRNRFGPGFLIAAAFIGPGTVTSATLAGAKFGYSLIWVAIIAIVSAIILQEMVGRFSLTTGMDIGSALVKIPENPLIKIVFQILAFLAIIVGCAAYEAGNIIGGALGINIISGISLNIWVIIISLIALILLFIGKYKIIEKFLVFLVVIMGISFFITAIIVSPEISEIIKGLKPSIPKGSITLILALLGTTIVPYNLFLHSSSVLKKWKSKDSIKLMRWDIVLAIGLGGFITIAIIITASVAYFLKHLTISSPADLSIQLKPLFGNFAEISFGIGLFSAGLSSAITAPYAASFTSKGLFGWKENNLLFKLIFTIVILTGVIISFLKIKPLSLIILAQVTNALLLPIVALFVFYLLNTKEVKEFKNNLLQNFLFIIIFLIIVLINVKKFF